MCAHWLYFVYFGREVDAVIMSWAGALHPTDIISIEFDVDGRWGGGGYTDLLWRWQRPMDTITASNTSMKHACTIS